MLPLEGFEFGRFIFLMYASDERDQTGQSGGGGNIYDKGKG